MSEYSMAEKAADWLRLQIDYTVLPADDQISDSREEYQLMLNQRCQSPACEEYVKALRAVLSGAPISCFMHAYLLDYARRSFTQGWTRPDPIPYVNKEVFGIDLDNQEYGFFDPKFAPTIEKNYFDLVQPLIQSREQAGYEVVVDWREWEKYLKQPRSFRIS